MKNHRQTNKTSLAILTRRTAGGIKAHILDLVKALDKNTYQITVIGPIDEDFSQKLKNMNAGVVFIDIADRVNPLKDVSSILKISLALRKIKPSILHIHGNKSALVGRWAAKFSKVNKVVVTVHNYLIYQQKKSLLSKLAFFEERRLSKSTDYIIAVSTQIKKRLIEQEGIDESKIIVVNNGIEVSARKTTDDTARDKYHISQDAFVALNIGRFVEFKGQKYLIEAVQKIKSKLPNFKLIILGTGPLKNELEKFISKLGLGEHIILLDQVDCTGELYNCADCFILPSTDEPFGLVLLEAMAYKLPIIAAKSGGVLDILDDNNALLVEPKSAQFLAEAIIRIAQNKKLSQNLSENAFSLLQDKFTLRQMVEKTEKLYASK